MSLMFGKHGENGIWFASKPQYKVMFSDHDSLYIALSKFRLRLMKP